MKVYSRLSVAYLSLFLFLCGFMFPLTGTSAHAAPRIPLELEETRQEISLLNLLRGLYLSKDQVKQLLELANQSQAIRDAALKPFLARKEQILADFNALRDSLYLAPGHEKAPQEKASNIDQEIKEGVGSVNDRVFALEEKAAAVLSSAQMCILEDFKPCLIPPHDLRNPVRVGQAGAAEGLLGKLTDLIHCAPEKIWKERGDQLLQRVTAKLEDKSGEISANLKQDLNKRLHEIARRIRECPDVDFAVKKHELAQELLVINPDKGLKHGHKKNGPVARWLLSDVSAKVLPQWLEAMDKVDFTTAVEEGEDPSIGLEQKEALAKVFVTLRHLHQKRSKKGAKLAPYDEFIAPLKTALKANDLNGFLKAIAQTAETLNQVQPGPDIVKLLVQSARGYGKVLNLPLFNPNQDPFGLVEDLKKAKSQSDPAVGARELQKIIATLQEFKRP